MPSPDKLHNKPENFDRVSKGLQDKQRELTKDDYYRTYIRDITMLADGAYPGNISHESFCFPLINDFHWEQLDFQDLLEALKGWEENCKPE